MEQFKKYYLLCTVRLGTKQHMVSDIQDTKLEVIFTKKEINLYLRKLDGKYIAREIIVGGSSGSYTGGSYPLEKSIIIW